MFDDQPKTKISSAPQTNLQTNPQAPANLPITDRGPEDILESFEPESAQDNFLEKPTVKVPQPKPNSFALEQNLNNPAAPVEPAKINNQLAENFSPNIVSRQTGSAQIFQNSRLSGFFGRKILVIFLSLFILALIVVAVILLYKIFVQPKQSAETTAETAQTAEQTTPEQTQEPVVPEQTAPEAPAPPQPPTSAEEPKIEEEPSTEPRPVILDTDQDGLADEEELALGTNPRVVDTDFDGLTDWEEVKVYHTDPALKDSDGDGYFDGQEVKSGYNPLGQGKLVK